MIKKSLKVVGSIVAVAALVGATLAGIGYYDVKATNKQLINNNDNLASKLELSEQIEGLKSMEAAENYQLAVGLGLQVEELSSIVEESREVIKDYELLLSETQAKKDMEIAQAVAEALASTELGVSSSAFEKDELALTFKGRLLLDDNDLEQLADSEFEFDNVDIKYETFLTLYGEFASNDKNFEGVTMYKLADDEVKYEVRFDQDMTKLDWTKDSVTIDFLGNSYEIGNYKDGVISLISSSNQFVTKGETTAGITLLKVGRDSVAVEYDGQIEVIAEREEFKFDGIEVRVESIFYADGSADDGAVLVIDSDLERSIEDGDDYSDEEIYQWFINKKGFGITLVEDYDEFDTALKEGDKFVLPNDFASVSFELSKPDMTDISFEYDKDGFVEIQADFEEYEGKILAYTDGQFYDDVEDEFIKNKRIYLKDSDAFITFDDEGNLRVKDVTIGFNVDKVIVNEIDMSSKDVDIKSVYGIEVSAPEDDLEDGELKISVPEEAIEVTIKVD